MNTPAWCRSVVGAAVVVTLLVFSLSTAYAQSDPLKCQRAIAKESSKYVKQVSKIVDKCKQGRLLKGEPPSFDDCTIAAVSAQPANKISKASSKLKASIAKKCGGKNKQCNVTDVGEDADAALVDINWNIAQCMNFESGLCDMPIVDCADIGDCLECIANAALEQGINGLLYDRFTTFQLGTASVVNICKATIAKEGVKFLQSKHKILLKCWDAKLKGKEGFVDGDPCPDTDPKLGSGKPPGLPGDNKTVEKIRKAEQKKVAKICKKCGAGGDTDKDGLCDEPASFFALNSIVPLPFTCDDLAVPPNAVHPAGLDCGAISVVDPGDQQAYIDCIDCILEFKVDCLAAAGVGDGNPAAGIVYPVGCNPTPTPTPTPSATPLFAPGLVFSNAASPDQPNRVCVGDGAGVFTCSDLGSDLDSSRGLGTGDFDRDGRTDVVVANWGAGDASSVCLDDGAGGFTCSALSPMAPSEGVGVGDFDRDGDLDLVIGNHNAGVDEFFLCLGNGDGTFAACTDGPTRLGRTPAVADMDRDGILDLVFDKWLCLGNGSGGFPSCNNINTGPKNSHRAVAVGDVDQDGNLDVVLANWLQNNLVCFGDGTGNVSGFACQDIEVSDTRASNGVALADLDHDGDLDAVFANEFHATQPPQNKVCLNDGSATPFASCTIDIDSDIYDSRDVAVADLDRDGNLDVAFANANQNNRFCAGDGASGFSCSDVSPDANSTTGVAVVAAPPDVQWDVFVANNNSFSAQDHQFCAGDGSGSFSCGDIVAATDTRNVAAGDVDRDGNLDVVLANDDPNQLCTGDGVGGLSCSTITSHALTTDVALGDLNQDGDLDAVFANYAYGFTNRFCAGTGGGSFGCGAISADIDNSRGVAVGDTDRDGDLDVVLANQGQRSRVCLGDGSGSFGCNDLSTDANVTFDVALADVDGNGALDAVFANRNQRNRVCLDVGTGGASCADVSTDAFDSVAIAAGDVNRDGRLDLVIANYDESDRYCRNDGGGVYTCSDILVGGTQTLDVRLADMNQDGKLDALFAMGVWPENQYCEGHGDGTFTCSTMSADMDYTNGIAVGRFIK